MSPRRATKTSWKPKEGRAFTGRAVKVSLHEGERARVDDQAAESNVTPAEWVREAARNALRAIYGD